MRVQPSREAKISFANLAQFASFLNRPFILHALNAR